MSEQERIRAALEAMAASIDADADDDLAAALRSGRRRRARRRVGAAAAMVALAGLATTIGTHVGGDDDSTTLTTTRPTATVAPEPDQSPSPSTTASGPTTPSTAVPTAALGEFAWPAPPRELPDVDALTDAFIAEVLGWQPDRVHRDTDAIDDDGPRSITLVNLDTDRELHLAAVPSDRGWGFTEIGDGFVIDDGASDGFAIQFRPPEGAIVTTIEVRYVDGTQTLDETFGTELLLPPDRPRQSVLSALLTYTDHLGAVVSVDGLQYAPSPDEVRPGAATGAGVQVPDAVGLSAREAGAMLESLGLETSMKEVVDRGVRSGTVIGIEPVPGSDVAVGTAVTLSVAARPSQRRADAARDAILPALAALPNGVRIRQVDGLFGPTRVDTPEGTWIISRPDADDIDALTDGCTLGDPAGLYGLERICVTEYAEILLLDPDSGAIVRAYPFPGLAPLSLQATTDALYCIRQGDGAGGTSMLCRIDLASLDAVVRAFPASIDPAFGPSHDGWIPPDWIIDEPTEFVLWSDLDADDSGVTIGGQSGTATVDPDTLALRDVELSTPE